MVTIDGSDMNWIATNNDIPAEIITKENVDHRISWHIRRSRALARTEQRRDPDLLDMSGENHQKIVFNIALKNVNPDM